MLLCYVVFLEENIKTHDVRTANIRHAEINKAKEKNIITTSRTVNVYAVLIIQPQSLIFIWAMCMDWVIESL